MGKQINYWLEFDSFVIAAKRALELGCTIVREDLDEKGCKVTESRDIGIVTDDNRACYFFHLPEAGDISIKKYDCGYRLDRGFNECENSVIEAGYSRILTDSREILRARLYLTTGYYDSNDTFIYRPDCIVKVYNSLARYVKKLAPYTELTGSYISIREENYGQRVEYKHKEYVSPYCLKLLGEGYSLG